MNRVRPRPAIVSGVRTVSRTGAGLAAAFLLAAIGVSCGSGSSSSTSTQGSAAVGWADHMCAALVSYKSSLAGISASVKATPSRSTLDQAGTDAKNATHTFVESVKGLGKPGTSAGATATQTLDALASDLRKDASTIESSTSGGSGVVQAVSVVSTTLVTAKDQVKAALETLRQLKPKDELSQAFAQAPSCSSLSLG
jgi:hypothetical protein